jgi:hypothetical protein
MKKSNSMFYFDSLKLLTNFENPSSNPFQRRSTGDFLRWKCLQETARDSNTKSLPVTSYFLRIFPAANERSSQENIDQSQRRVSESILKKQIKGS